MALVYSAVSINLETNFQIPIVNESDLTPIKRLNRFGNRSLNTSISFNVYLRLEFSFYTFPLSNININWSVFCGSDLLHNQFR